MRKSQWFVDALIIAGVMATTVLAIYMIASDGSF